MAEQFTVVVATTSLPLAAFIQQELADTGLRLVRLADPAQFLRRLKNVVPQVVLLDANYPTREETAALATRLRQKPGLNEIPLVLLTTHFDPFPPGFENLPDDHRLEEPFDRPAILAAIKAASGFDIDIVNPTADEEAEMGEHPLQAAAPATAEMEPAEDIIELTELVAEGIPLDQLPPRVPAAEEPGEDDLFAELDDLTVETERETEIEAAFDLGPDIVMEVEPETTAGIEPDMEAAGTIDVKTAAAGGVDFEPAAAPPAGNQDFDHTRELDAAGELDNLLKEFGMTAEDLETGEALILDGEPAEIAAATPATGTLPDREPESTAEATAEAATVAATEAATVGATLAIGPVSATETAAESAAVPETITEDAVEIIAEESPEDYLRPDETGIPAAEAAPPAGEPVPEDTAPMAAAVSAAAESALRRSAAALSTRTHESTPEVITDSDAFAAEIDAMSREWSKKIMASSYRSMERLVTAIGDLAPMIVEQVAKEIIPPLAEKIIKAEIERLEQEIEDNTQ
ncbi:MAG: response regulator transcription factor [Deltaproteobacteria bacterium]|nr:response regulator transcription factor [Candidatus Anaeroferrophillacea bacterium]